MIEKRRYQRVEFLCEVALTALPAGRPVSAWSIDLSMGGVCLIAQSPLMPGQLVTVSFLLKHTAQGKLVDHVVGKVMHFRVDGDANQLGVEFLEPLNESQHPELMKRLLTV
jgi:c-di-GMP-binding flagellar brake protein YcgR